MVQAEAEWAWPLRFNDRMSHGWLAWQGACLTNTGIIYGIDCYETCRSFFVRKTLHIHTTPPSQSTPQQYLPRLHLFTLPDPRSLLVSFWPCWHVHTAYLWSANDVEYKFICSYFDVGFGWFQVLTCDILLLLFIFNYSYLSIIKFGLLVGQNKTFKGMILESGNWDDQLWESVKCEISV